MPKQANNPINALNKKIAKLEKEVKKHQDFIDAVINRLTFGNPVLFASIWKYKSQNNKKSEPKPPIKKTARLSAKKN